jgi:hypothetical protein
MVFFRLQVELAWENQFQNCFGEEIIMATCASCGNSILWGGVRLNGSRYCGQKCCSQDELGRLAASIPEQAVKIEAKKIRNGNCPVCSRRGEEIELRKSYKAISYVIVTRWGVYPIVSCSSCHRKKVLGDFILTLCFGWWGFPWGMIITPVQLIRNICAVATDTKTSEPSQELCSAVRTMMAQTNLSLQSASSRQPGKGAEAKATGHSRDAKLRIGSPG